MRAEIISVGTELLLGDIVNTNAQFLAQQLARLGYEVYYQTVVGDNIPRLRELVHEAKIRSDVLVFTGGLGPTEDDLTKEVVADAFGDKLVLDVDEQVRLEQFFKKRGVRMTQNNLKQAMVPTRGQKIPNVNGTAPGAFFRQGRKYAILLPGPPREMQPMFTEQVVPLLEAMQDSTIRSITLRVFGIGESELEDRVGEFLEGSNPTAALYAKTGEVHIRITAKAESAEQAEVMCDDYARLFLRALADLVYSVNGDDLETTAVKLLVEEGSTVATAESCTGGLLGERITSVPGASAVYGYGNITYANEAKHRMLGVRNSTLQKHGAVSSQVAAEMAFGAAARSGDTYGIGITGIAGPDGGTPQKPVGLVYIALARGREVFVKKLNAPDRGREHVRHMATQHALDMLRRALLGIPIPDAKPFTKSQEADYERVGRPRRRSGPLVRSLIAFAVVLALILLLVLGTNLFGGGNVPTPPSGSLPSAQGYVYGTDEYTAAACALVEQEKEENSAVMGFVAMPEARVEQLVGKSATTSQAALAENPGDAATGGMPVIAGEASPAKLGTNTLVVGGAALSAIAELQDPEFAGEISTFTWYTATDAKVYQVFALYEMDEADTATYDPAVESVSTYGAFLDYTLGAQARSQYDITVDVAEKDSYMTLAAASPSAEGRTLYLVGRLTRPDEEVDTAAAVPAASPLMPTAWYEERGAAQPLGTELYDTMIRRYLTRGISNSDLQLYAGMPATDAMPMVDPPEVSIPQPDPPASSVPESSSEAASSSSSQSASSSSGTSSSSSASSSATSSSAASSSSENRTPTGGDGGDGGTQAGLIQATAMAWLAEANTPDSNAGASSDGADSDTTGADAPVQQAPSSSSSLYIPPKAVPYMSDPEILTVTMNGKRVTGSTRDILAQICQAEAEGMGKDAVQAVAIAAHSWILAQQGAGNEAPPVVGREASAFVLAAVDEVAGVVLTAGNDAPAFTPWYASAAHATNDAADVWGGSRDYLESQPSPYDESQDGWRRIVTLSQADFAAIVTEKLGVELDEADPTLWVGGATRNEGGYVQSVTIAGVEVSGLSVWRDILLVSGEPLLSSSAFEVELDGDDILFINYGDGHGCGLSTSGAGAYAREGWSFDRILEHYFPGTTLMQLQG